MITIRAKFSIKTEKIKVPNKVMILFIMPGEHKKSLKDQY